MSNDPLVRLVRKLNTDTTSFFIHVDKKTDNETYERMVESLSANVNVCFLERHVCNWGDFGHVKATLKGIQEILTRDVQCDYAILLTGQDYPIKSNSYIQKVLQENMSQSFIKYSPLPWERWKHENGGLDRITYWHFYWRRRRIAFPKKKQFYAPVPNLLWSALIKPFPIRRKLPGHFKLFGGSSYWCLSRDCIKYIYEFVQQNEAFVKFFKYVNVPDEIFFQTVILNSPLKDHLINKHLTYIDWSKPNSPHPAILRQQHFERFISTDKLFARKFDVTVDAGVLDMIDDTIS